MTPRRIAVWTAAVSIALTHAALAQSQGTEQQREACTPDVFRLCAAYIPDAERITACLRSNGARLSPACHEVFFPPQDNTAAPQSVNPSRREPVPLTPPDDDDN